MKARAACCSFCRQPCTVVGTLVEGPGNVYICGECIPLCQSILEQEHGRRNRSRLLQGPSHLREALDKVVSGHEEAKQALVQAASLRQEGQGRALLISASRGARQLLARALAYALAVPFAAGDLRGLVKSRGGTEDNRHLLFSLLDASGFDIQAAQQGMVYVEDADRPEVQEALSQLWDGQIVELFGRLQFHSRRVLFVCGGTFAGLDECFARSGRHAEHSVTAEELVTAGARSEWARHLVAIARAAPLDDEALTRIVGWIDFSRMDSQNAEPGAAPGGGVIKAF
jgi:ATP-dependent Clp protease ATP-binding subunit ClpX